MKIQEIGRMLYTLRKERSISQEELCRGICSIATLSRFEKGECRPDIYIFHALLERLGRTAKDINIVLTLEEFEYLVKKRNVEIAFLSKNYEQAEKDLIHMEEELYNKGISLQKQDIYCMRGLFCLHKEQNYTKALEWIEKALKETISDRKTSIYFCNSEIQLMLLYVYLNSCLGIEKMELLTYLLHYVNRYVTDVRMKNTYLSKISHLQAYLYKKNQNWNVCYDCCERAVVAEIENSRLAILFQALKLQVECLEQGVCTGNGELRRRQYAYLKEVVEEYKVSIDRFSMFTSEMSHGRSLVDEVIHYARIRGEYTQEEFSEGICTPETLSRIETGKRTPTIKNFYALMEKSGMGISYYNTEFELERFETMEKIADLRKLAAQGKQEEAEALLKEVELEIDISKNQQQIGIFHTVYDWRAGRITLEEALEQSEQLAALSLKKINGRYVIPYQVTIVEFNILNQIAVYYDKLGKTEQAIEEIFMPLYEHFEAKKLANVELGREYLMVTINLAIFYEKLEEWEKALAMIEKTIATVLEEKWIAWLGYSLFIKYKLQKKLGQAINLEQQKKAYFINMLGGDVETAKDIRSYVWDNWRVVLEEY